jgi:hypothetical protein
LISGFVSLVWILARDNAKKGNYKSTLWKGFLWCVGIAFLSSMMMGNATCESVSDPVYGECEQYADDGYEPTTQQQTSKFAYLLTLMYVPIIIGAMQGKKDKKLSS